MSDKNNYNCMLNDLEDLPSRYFTSDERSFINLLRQQIDSGQRLSNHHIGKLRDLYSDRVIQMANLPPCSFVRPDGSIQICKKEIFYSSARLLITTNYVEFLRKKEFSDTPDIDQKERIRGAEVLGLVHQKAVQLFIEDMSRNHITKYRAW